MAWQAALLVELCIISAAMSFRIELKRVAYALFTYNILVFGATELDQILAKKSLIQVAEVVLENKKNQIINLRAELEKLSQENSKGLKRLEEAHARGLITSGTFAFEKTSSIIEVNRNTLSSKIAALEKEVLDLSQSQHSFQWVCISSFLYFLLRCLLQFFQLRFRL